MDNRKFCRRREVPVGAVMIVLLLTSMAISAPKAPPAGSADAQSTGNSAYEKALKPSEALVGVWDFAGASAAMAKLKFQDKVNADRLAGRQDEVKRLAALKTKIIEQAKELKPWLRRGMKVVGSQVKTVGAQITKADEKAVTVNKITARGQTSSDKPWAELTDEEVAALLKAAVSTKNADDQLAAGLLALARSDATTAEVHFDRAQSLGAKTQRYLGPLAAAAFAQVNELLKTKKVAEAGAAMKALEKKYAGTPWMDSHKEELEATRILVTDAEAENLLAQAAILFKQGSFFDLKPLVDKLAKDYASSRAVTDEKRKPSFAEMEQAVAGYGELITVSKRGKAKFKTIQTAIKAAPPKSVIEILDSETYEEELIIPEDKEGLVIRGKRGAWPVIKTRGVSVRAPRVAIQQVILIGEVAINRVPFSLREAILVSERRCLKGGDKVEVDSCLLVGEVGTEYGWAVRNFSVKNSFFLRGRMATVDIDLENVFVSGKVEATAAKLQSCTFADGIRCNSEKLTVLDSIISYVEAVQNGARIEYCDVFGKGYLLLAKAGKGCFSKDPGFRNPKEFDYRLKVDSPCRKKASDGGDVGMRQTPEMEGILKKALELRAEGVIKF